MRLSVQPLEVNALTQCTDRHVPLGADNLRTRHLGSDPGDRFPILTGIAFKHSLAFC
jgi:hypothetical protein